MISNYQDEVSPVNVPGCECYKKLDYLGIPLYIGEENQDYAENEEVWYEKAFNLPGLIRINEQVTKYPVVEGNELSIVFQIMAQVIPSLADFEVNLLSFWILDMFIEGLSTAQKAEFPHDRQSATLIWIAYFFNYMQKYNPTRKEMFNHLKTILFLPGAYDKSNNHSEEFGEGSTKGDEKDLYEEFTENKMSISGEKFWELPLPPTLEGFKNKKAFNDDDTIKSSNSSNTEIVELESISRRNVRHMTIILEILYRIFGRVSAFMEIQAAFHKMPTIENVELPFVLHVPKPLLSTESLTRLKGDKGEKQGDSLEETERRLHKNYYILSLQESEEVKLSFEQNKIQPSIEVLPPVFTSKGRKKR